MSNLLSLLTPQRLMVVFAALVLAACESTPKPKQTVDLPLEATGDPTEIQNPATLPNLEEREIVRVAILLPLSSRSGPIQDLAIAMRNAAQMVAFESGNESFLLIPGDTRGTPMGARQAAAEAIEGGADIILGPLLSDSVRAVADVARMRNIPVVAFSNDSSVAGDGVYLLSFPPEPEIDRVTSYAISRGYARFGLLAPITAYGDRVSDAFREQIYQGGGELVHSERYIRNVQDMQEPARRLAEYAAPGFIPQYVSPRRTGSRAVANPFRPRRETVSTDAGDLLGQSPLGQVDAPNQSYDPVFDGFQAVLLPESGRMLRALAPLLPYNDVDVREIKLLGVSSWNNPNLRGEPALAGGWFAAPDPDVAKGFSQRYETAYGKAPPRLASLAYDATLVAARLAEADVPNPYSQGLLTNPNGFYGADGLFRLTPAGVVERGLAILELSRSGVRVIDPAPSSFAEKPSEDRF
ncbi:MAG: penicillin-binding protein activator [Parvularculaceae bacterium]|nr:penicillin-binding protein activator [Parvularculaceae bacterium]